MGPLIILLAPDSPETVVSAVMQQVSQFKELTAKKHVIQGASHSLTEIYLIGPTQTIPTSAFENIGGVQQVIRISVKYRMIGRHTGQTQSAGFQYNGVDFTEKQVHLFAGLCAVDTRQHVEMMMAALQKNEIVTTRMGAYKPRTSPYDFQGLGKACLPYVFELAGKYGIRVVAMEITHPRQIDEINEALESSGKATGVMLQIGTRNAQNFELLKQVGQQSLPVLFKRGMGITLEESLNACEYVASEGNRNIVFCLRGVKTHLGDPHRNLVDFAHVPVVRRLTRLAVCVDPSHSVGVPDAGPDGLPDIFHTVGQGLISGATMVLVDFHPNPKVALCDGPQALALEQLPRLKRYAARVRQAYLEAVADA